MHIDQADAPRVERVGFDQQTHFAQMGNIYLSQLIQLGKCLAAIMERAEGNFGDNERVDCDAPILQHRVEIRIEETKMIHPDGSVGKNHRDYA